MKNSEVSKIWMILPRSIVIVLNCTTRYKAVFKGPLPKIYWIFLGTLTYGVHNVPKCAFFEIFKRFKWGLHQCACCNCIYTKSLLIFSEQNIHWKIWKKNKRWLFLEKYSKNTYLYVSLYALKWDGTKYG